MVDQPTMPPDWPDCPRCGAMTFWPSGRCMQACDTQHREAIMSETARWYVGQECVINRREIVRITGITPTGRLKVGTRTFNKHGNERGSTYSLEPLTEEIREEMRRRTDANEASVQLDGMREKLKDWCYKTFSNFYSRKPPSAADIHRAKRLTAAIAEILGEPTE